MTMLLETRQWLPRSVEEVFDFFADAANLNDITPPWLGFRILTPQPVEMQAGALIDYRIRLRGVPIRWRTEITCWEPPVRFVDEQIHGPYRLWRHEHTFHAENGGTWVEDRVEYRLLLGDWLPGHIAHRLWIRPELDRIFAYRQQRMRLRFGSGKHE